MAEEEKEKILDFLQFQDIEFSHEQHGHIHTAEDAARERGVPLSQNVKSLILSVNDEDAICIQYVLPGDKQADFDALSEALNAESVALADPDVVEDVTGCRIGTVPPFGPLLGVVTYVSDDVFRHDEVWCSAATHTDSVRIPTSLFKQRPFNTL